MKFGNIDIFLNNTHQKLRGWVRKYVGIKFVRKAVAGVESHVASIDRDINAVTGWLNWYKETYDDDRALGILNDKLDSLYERITNRPARGGWQNDKFVQSSPTFGTPRGIDRGVLQALGRRVRNLESALEQIMEAVQRERSICDNHPDLTPTVSNADGSDDMGGDNNEQGGGK